MALGDYTIPRPNSPFSEGGGNPTREWYNYLRVLGSGGNTQALADDIATISTALGSPDGTPGHIPPLGGGGNVIGIDSIQTYGALPGVVQLTLLGDVLAPGNAYYYGTDTGGNKGFFTVSSTLLGTAGDITLTVGANGVTTFDLAPVADSGVGALLAITRDGFGRVTGTKAATITGTANRVAVTNGNAVAGVPTIDIDAAYAGQASITTLGTITTGTWAATTLAIAHGGTGQTTAAAAFDALAPTTTNQDLIVRGLTSNTRLGVGTNGQVLTVTSGAVGWSTPASGGSVTSVALGAPSQFTVTGSPVTTSGTLTFAWNTQTANAVLAGPTTGAAAAPTFRSLVAADIPALDFTKITTGTVPIAQGGTGQVTANAAFTALSPMTTAGDLVSFAGGVATRLAVGTAGQVLTVVGGAPTWQTGAGGGLTEPQVLARVSLGI